MSDLPPKADIVPDGYTLLAMTGKRRCIQVKFPDKNLDNNWFAAIADATQIP